AGVRSAGVSLWPRGQAAPAHRDKGARDWAVAVVRIESRFSRLVSPRREDKTKAPGCATVIPAGGRDPAPARRAASGCASACGFALRICRREWRPDRKLFAHEGEA